MGKRTNHAIPKQFIKVGNKTVIEYSLETFTKKLDHVVLVVPDIKQWEAMSINFSGTVVEGGKTRSLSLLKGLSKVKTPKVLIHDASRPIVPEDIIDNVGKSLDEYVCAYPVLPVKSTVVVDSNNQLQTTLDRSTLREIQTPQGFQTQWLVKAMEELGDQHSHIPELIRKLGEKVKHIEGSPWLFKITYAPDIYSVELLINKYKSQVE